MPEESEKNIQPQVLIVDDDPIVRGIARESLEEAGFEVSEAENGLEALEAVQENKPDIILLDVMMPEMDGFATCNILRKTSGCEMIPVLILTALDDVESINRAYEVGATDFITKPINWVILVQRVRYMTRAARMLNERKRLEKELQQAQKLEAVATLAGGIAHDFNNLLQTVQGFAELLLLKVEKDEFGYMELHEIYAAARRGGELTRQLLTYSRKLTSEKSIVNLNNRIRQVNELLRRTIPKMIEIEMRLDSDIKEVNADPLQVEQVLMNLAVNAKDAMPDGGKLVIETENVTLDDAYCLIHSKATPGDYVLVRVSDTGQGIDSDIIEHIFEPFFSTKAPGKGTGLGLSMVHGIIENHCGHITCQSDPATGTTFELYFPVGVASREIMPGEETCVSTIQGGNEVILVVDDEDSIRTYSQRSLEKEGYTVLTAADGESALQIYDEKKNTIDLVLLDIIMPGMGGKKCLQKLIEFDPDVKVVIASGYSPDNQINQFTDHGACGYLRKPYIGKQMLQMVRKALDRN